MHPSSSPARRSPRAFVAHATVLLAVLLAASGTAPARADDDLVTQMRNTVKTGQPTPQLMNAFTQLPSFEMDVHATAAALRGFNLPPTATQALLGISHISKRGDTVTIRTKGELTLPIVVNGQMKGWAKLDDPVSFRIRPDGKGVLLDQFQGMSVGPWQSLTIDLKHLTKADWQPAKNGSQLAITAGWWIFSGTLSLALPDPAPAAPARPSKTPGITSKVTERP